MDEIVELVATLDQDPLPKPLDLQVRVVRQGGDWRGRLRVERRETSGKAIYIERRGGRVFVSSDSSFDEALTRVVDETGSQRLRKILRTVARRHSEAIAELHVDRDASGTRVRVTRYPAMPGGHAAYLFDKRDQFLQVMPGK